MTSASPTLGPVPCGRRVPEGCLCVATRRRRTTKKPRIVPKMARTAKAAATIPPMAPLDKDEALLLPVWLLFVLLEEPLPLAESTRTLAGKAAAGFNVCVSILPLPTMT